MKVLTDSKHCCNQHGSSINLFSRQFDLNIVAKSDIQSDMKS